MAYPHSHAGFHREFAWQESRLPESSHRPRYEPAKIALPSIRQAFPEFHLDVQPDDVARRPSSVTSPISGPLGVTVTPEYIHSPNINKRRRLSFEAGIDDERPSQIPRLYASPRAACRQQSPEPWGSSVRSSPYLKNGALPSIRSPGAIEMHERAEPRPSLPSLPHMEFERGAAQMPRMRSLSRDEYRQEPVRHAISHAAGPPAEAEVPLYRQTGYDYGYHHPTRVQSLSLDSIHPYDRSPFASVAYGQHFQDTFMRIGGDLGMGMNGDNKQRKRRGNLPKETTDKLRAWFVAHLHHPYPTEDEKQDLMRHTGLQMNQISNWFINARRRQLPTMINNARAESDAMTGRGGDGKVLPSTERSEYERDMKRPSVSLSDGEASNFDDVDMDTITRRRSSNMERGSV
ncbi:homeobox domain-containing protein [Xylariales sp. AK1849]|nr:homeobox domain-containing protein [Xylariales sp. AK1849]